MALEIERKFLVQDDAWRDSADAGRRMRQGYLAGGERLSIRVRVAGDKAWLNIKHAERLTVRREFEYAVPLADAEEILAHVCDGPVVDKTRFRVGFAGRAWEVDVFHGDNEGLVVAEIELDAADAPFARPPWLGEEVSEDPRYLNQNLARRPYRTWRHPASEP